MKTHVCLIAHAPYASASYEVVRHVLGDQEGVSVYDIPADVDPDQQVQAMVQALLAHQAEHGETQLVVVGDLIGATPCNIGRRVAQQCLAAHFPACFITGMNVCMLLSLVRYRHNHTLPELVEIAQEAGIKGIRSTDLVDLNDHLFE